MYRFWAFSVKHATQQKFESLRATFLSKLHNMVSNNSDFIQSMLNSLQNGGCLFIITTLLVHATNATISSKNQFFYFSQFSPPLFHPYLFTKSSLQSPLTFSSSILQQFFTSFFLRTNIPTMYTKNILPTSTILPIKTASRDQWVWESFEDWHGFNFSFLQDMDSENRAHNHWFFITQSLKILYCRCIAGVANHPIHLLSNPQTIVISSRA